METSSNQSSFDSINIKSNYPSRVSQIRAEMSQAEVIRQIRDIYHAEYDPDCGLDGCFDARKQLFACERLLKLRRFLKIILKTKMKNRKKISVLMGVLMIAVNAALTLN